MSAPLRAGLIALAIVIALAAGAVAGFVAAFTLDSTSRVARIRTTQAAARASMVEAAPAVSAPIGG